MSGLGRKTFVAGEVLLAQELNDYLMDQSVMNFASEAARSSAIPTPTEGMLSLTKDNDEIDYYNGTTWVSALPIGAWKEYDPVLSQGWANGNGVYGQKRYVQIGKTVHVQVAFTTGSTTTKGTTMDFSLPVTGQGGTFTGTARFTVGGTTTYGLVVLAGGAATCRMYAMGSAGSYVNQTNITNAIPGAWVGAGGDLITWNLTYEAA